MLFLPDTINRRMRRRFITPSESEKKKKTIIHSINRRTFLNDCRSYLKEFQNALSGKKQRSELTSFYDVLRYLEIKYQEQRKQFIRGKNCLKFTFSLCFYFDIYTVSLLPLMC